MAKERKEKEEKVKCIDCGRPVLECECAEIDDADVGEILEDNYDDNQFGIV
jgi:hypothetical protein